ncbi:MAG: cellulase family glycosylhydrolase [Candidatus Aminicenantes bacterium]|nr:cellulase family glycosylhydrolase [Candidatus Aminicenantes bacterium]
MRPDRLRTKAGLTVAFLAILAWPGLRAETPKFDTILYGASYYWEYMPYERLEKDFELMEKAGINFIRVGESTWGVLEPSDGRFDFDWLERVLDRAHRAGIKVILGTPTYSIPAWLFKKHPEIQVKQTGQPRYTYGLRQMTDLTHPVYRRYAERIIRKLVARFRDHPAVVGYQLDNETHHSGTADVHVQAAFRERLRRKFVTPGALNKAWGLNYWGQRVNSFDEVPPRDGALNPGTKLEWERFLQDAVTEFLGWQAAIVRGLKRPDQFITHDFCGGLPTDVRQVEIARAVDVPAVNIYFGLQDDMTGLEIAFSGDINRSLNGSNYLVTETTAQTTGWSSEGQYPPYDGQLRLAAYANILSGANLVAYWHWHSLHFGQETYWKGVLGHDLEPGRAFSEVTRIAGELRKIGPVLANLKKKNRVAILYSLDSLHALGAMPFDAKTGYMTILDQLYRALYGLNVETDFLYPEEPRFSDYSLVIVPALYIADDVLLRKLSDYVKGGGRVLMTFKSGFCDENATVRWTAAPGPLREACGFSYQEFTNLKQPLRLKGDPFKAGEANRVSVWAEYLLPEACRALAYYDHPVFGAFPAITRNGFGKGVLTYEGTVLSDALQAKVVADCLNEAGIPLADAALPKGVKAKHAVLADGAEVHAYFNFSGARREFLYGLGEGRDILTGKTAPRGGKITLGPWDLAIVRVDASK